MPAAARYAACHNYYLPPFGPFSSNPSLEHTEAVCALDGLLCPCVHHAEYLRRHGPANLPRATPLFAADYRYFHSTATEAGAEPRLPPPMRPWERGHCYVSLVSACPAKGLAVLLALARAMPDVRGDRAEIAPRSRR